MLDAKFSWRTIASSSYD